MKRILLLAIAASALFASAGYSAAATSILVTDHKGKPIPKAEVRVGSNNLNQAAKTLRADSKGRVSLVGEASYFVYAPGYCLASGWLSAPAKKGAAKKVVLWPGVTLKGKITDEAGKPLSGVTVRLSRFDAYNYAHGESARASLDAWGPGYSWERLTVVTGKDGSYVIEGPPDPKNFTSGSASLEFRKVAKAQLDEDVDLEALSKRHDVTLPREAILTGTVYLPGKKGPAPRGQQVMVQMFQGNGWRTAGSDTDGKGRFEVRGLVPGKVNVYVVPSNRSTDFGGDFGTDVGRQNPAAPWVAPATVGFELSAGETTNLDVVLTEGVLVKGKVVSKVAGAKIGRGEINVVDGSRPKGGPTNSVSVNKDGMFEFRATAGEIRVSVNDLEIGGSDVYYGSDEDAPKVAFTAAEGEQKNDVVLEIAQIERPGEITSGMDNPVPASFTLTPGTYTLAWDPDLSLDDLVYAGSSEEDSTTVLRNIRKMPSLISAKPLRYALRVDGSGDDGSLAVVLDESKGTGAGYDTAYLDANRNLDLTDDRVYTWELLKDGADFTGDWVEIPARQGVAGGERTYNPMKIRLRVSRYDKDYNVSAARRGGWKGKIGSSKGEIECNSIDYNSNGVYGERAKITYDLDYDYETGDYIFADVNGYGRVLRRTYTPHAIQLSKVAMLADKGYVIEVSAVGDVVTIAPYTGAMARVSVKPGAISGLLTTATYTAPSVVTPYGCYEAARETSSVKIPAGPFKVSAGLHLVDDPKTSISAESSASYVAVPGKTAAVTLGGTVSAAICPGVKQLILTSSVKEPVDWVIRAGDKTTISSVYHSGFTEPPTIVKFFDRKGKMLGKTEMEFT